MQDNLRLARNNLKQATERAKFYADKKRPRRVFNEKDRVFLQVLLKSTSLSIGKCPKLSPRSYGPSKIVKRSLPVGVTTRLSYPSGVSC